MNGSSALPHVHTLSLGDLRHLGLLKAASAAETFFNHLLDADPVLWDDTALAAVEAIRRTAVEAMPAGRQ